MTKLHVAKRWPLIPAFALIALGVAAGCENTAGDCQLTAECTGGPGNTTTTTSSTSATTTTTTTTVETTCIPSDATAPLPATCGFFASPGATPDGADGTPEHPFPTLAAALSAAKNSTSRRVYACTGTFAESLTLPPDITLHGGLDCTRDWAFTEEGRTTIAPEAGVPLVFDPGKKTRVENVTALAPAGAPPDPASPNPLSGGSSIAALAMPAAIVDLVRCELTAGDGADGDAAPELPPAPAAADGAPGTDACDTGSGGPGAAPACGNPPVAGGDGGNGGDEVNGEPTPGAPGGGVLGGAPGQPQVNLDVCSEGGAGDPGQPGKPGEGGKLMTTLLDPELKGSPGIPGEDGRPGDGGGGGGGGKACTVGAGPGGGGGGGGGCPGAKGGGGGAGGSSIALWAAGAEVTLTQVTLTTQSGGDAGQGAPGQQGGAGGAGGPPGAPDPPSAACAGGPGGPGGQGGPGGGGQGGHAVAIVWTKATPPVLVRTTIQPGTAGTGAEGGTPADPTLTGENGLTCDAFDVDSGTCQSP